MVWSFNMRNCLSQYLSCFIPLLVPSFHPYMITAYKDKKKLWLSKSLRYECQRFSCKMTLILSLSFLKYYQCLLLTVHQIFSLNCWVLFCYVFSVGHRNLNRYLPPSKKSLGINNKYFHSESLGNYQLSKLQFSVKDRVLTPKRESTEP